MLMFHTALIKVVCLHGCESLMAAEVSVEIGEILTSNG